MIINSNSVVNAAEDNNESAMQYSDVSDYVIQDGGFLKETSSSSVYSNTKIKSNKKNSALRSGNTSERNLVDELRNAWDLKNKSLNILEFGLTQPEFSEILIDTLNKYPEYFYVSSGYSYYTSGSYVSIVEFKYKNEDDEIDAMNEEIDEEVDMFMDGLVSSWSDLEKVLYINDYLTRLCEYDRTLNRTHKGDIYGVFVEHCAVCQGYAVTTKYLCDKLGIECYVVTSRQLNHAWNMIKINGNYYMLDVTWNDPVADKLGRSGHNHFLKSNEYFNSDTNKHKASDYVVQGGLSPEEASDDYYDGYFWNGISASYEYLNGTWYGLYNNDLYEFSCDGTDLIKGKFIVSIRNWPIKGSNYIYYAKDCLSLSIYNGNLIYSNPDKIYASS